MNASTPTRRWFHPTPGWLVLASLLLTGSLFLSERFRWFAFNQHKGWTVLIAVASVIAVLVIMLLWWLAALVLRWRFQFSIRSRLQCGLFTAIRRLRCAPLPAIHVLLLRSKTLSARTYFTTNLRESTSF